MLFKLSNWNSSLAKTLGYLNRALNNSALMLKVFNLSIISDKTPHTNKGRFYGHTFCNVTARDVLSTIS